MLAGEFTAAAKCIGVTNCRERASTATPAPTRNSTSAPSRAAVAWSGVRPRASLAAGSARPRRVHVPKRANHPVQRSAWRIACADRQRRCRRRTPSEGAAWTRPCRSAPRNAEGPLHRRRVHLHRRRLQDSAEHRPRRRPRRIPGCSSFGTPPAPPPRKAAQSLQSGAPDASCNVLSFNGPSCTETTGESIRKACGGATPSVGSRSLPGSSSRSATRGDRAADEA